ncbi:MAG: carboxypeptidase-like regulatory domain-containing protein, partial [Balneola sp.]
MKPSIFSLFCFFTLLNLSVQSQNSVISGKVIDKETKQPIPGANVYLSDTVVGASTDENGMYSFKTDLSGDYTLSVTFVGYSSKNNPLLLEQNIDIVVNFELVEATLQLDQIEISGSDKKWAKQIAQFKDFFLGTDEFATITFIENPEVINFEETGADNTLSVSSLEPLIINNHALGYKISVQFGDVRFDPFSKIGSYVVFPRFSEMETTSTRQQKIWEKN